MCFITVNTSVVGSSRHVVTTRVRYLTAALDFFCSLNFVLIGRSVVLSCLSGVRHDAFNPIEWSVRKRGRRRVGKGRPSDEVTRARNEM